MVGVGAHIARPGGPCSMRTATCRACKSVERSMGTGVVGSTETGEVGQNPPGARLKVTRAGLSRDGTAAGTVVFGVERAAMATEVATEVPIPVGVNPVETGEGNDLETKETRIGEASGARIVVVV